ncbi:PREDICTED: SET and MYND domain-containing protein 4-like [Ceratosolen solmsi marchali]|uniref:SET and MYND domain-containing protein 4-like n=1 Tax=Ceratosolen solmsi marchali TaxID=326594 RepID=A0AAJ6YU58_9HYME|nr:PREDICTED: SET and MYND domain-containing protein 4-like [Ceratosolen solmsi marchali]
MDLAKIKELILAIKKNDSHSGYGLQKECELLIGHVLNNMAKSKLPNLIADMKNDEDAKHYRDEGNQYFVMGDDDDAIEKYSKSLAYASSKEAMAVALANRSAALYRKQLYRECLIDIDTALAHGYPEDKKSKLKERAEKAIHGLQQAHQIKDQNMNDLPLSKHSAALLQSNKNNVSQNKMNLSMIKEFINENGASKGNVGCCTKEDLEELMLIIPESSPRYLAEESEPSLAYETSDEAPALSKGVRIAYSKKYGRHLVATRSFKPGSIILKENPFAYIIYTEKHYTHCHHCLARSYNLISCPKCPIAQYCSEICKTSAWKMAHRIECPIHAVMSKLFNVDTDKIRMLTKIIRLLIIATKNGSAIDELRKDIQVAEQNSDKRTAGFTNDQMMFDGSSARCALSLATNLTTRPFPDISAFACISALATVLLATESEFFGKKYAFDELEHLAEQSDVKFCGTLVFRNCLIVSSNSFSIQLEPGIKVGSGLYVTASLLNHSCAPNTFRHFDSLTMITRALEPIKEGDQIFTCYGGGYQYMSRPERQSKMMQDYFFNCDCLACIDDWPTYSEILRNHIGSITKTNKKLVKKLKPFRQRLLSNKYDIEAVKTVLDLLHTEVKMPCEEIVHAIQYLKSYYLGKFHLINESHIYKA